MSTPRESTKRYWIYVAFLLCLAAAVTSSAQTFKTLATFDGKDGFNPVGTLVQGFDGNFYGTTGGGGPTESGTVFRISHGGTLTVIHYFSCSNRQTNCPDGSRPEAGLVLASDGNLYGTTFGFGDCSTQNHFDCGSVFRITPSGTLTTLYRFCSQTNCADGANPNGLIQGDDGNFYGTTGWGGLSSGTCQDNFGCGTVFKIAPNGALTTLYNFCATANCRDGERPLTPLVQARDGNFYGTTQAGGTSTNINGIGGTAFKLTPTGILTTLYDFCSQTNCTDGFAPSGLIQATNGNFYGSTQAGGAGGQLGAGSVFKLTPGGTLTTLYSFLCSQSKCPEGSAPGGLVQATDGNFYGTTALGGERSNGTAFKITSGGTQTMLHSFCLLTNCADGAIPNGLFQATDGNFYGTTRGGGGTGAGTVFELSVGLGPFVRTVPGSGKVGTTVTILGTSLTGTTSVSFHGTKAPFTVVSATQIKTAVPSGATTGTVTVTTPSGTLKSNVAFEVLP